MGVLREMERRSSTLSALGRLPYMEGRKKLALMLGRPIASHRLRSSCMVTNTPSDHAPSIMQHCHCSQLLSGAAAGPPHRLPPPPVLLQVGRHTLRPCASYHGGLPSLSAALWCGCRAVQSVLAALSSFLRMHEHSFRLHACPAVHGLAVGRKAAYF